MGSRCACPPATAICKTAEAEQRRRRVVIAGVSKPNLRQKLYILGCRFSDWGANIAGHPLALILVILFCFAWFLLPLGESATAVLTLVLSVLAITLTQMVLNQQKRHEIALHMKIDELIHAMRGARDEVMGIEHKSEAELEALRITGDIAEEVLEKRHGKSISTRID
ncbi:MAG: hypothetical protein EOP62_17780 [Sphingomonadales bacterium]|nr:MAG: hypothetical protein EOP62_17780 [Sphingomonadales bacterium]